jgi:PAS domain S-box-containing protein
MTWAELTYPEDLQPDVKQFNKIMDGEIDSYQMDKRFIKKNGEIVYVHLTVSCIRNSDGTVKHILATLQDITDRKKSEEALIHEKIFTGTVINAQRDTFFVFDPSTGKPLRWNKAFNDISGYTDEEILKIEAPVSYYSEEDLKRLATSTKLIEQGETTINEANLITKGGDIIPFEYAASGIFDDDGKLKYIVAIGRNITERKKSEQKVKDLARFPSENPNPVLRATINEILYANHSGKNMFNIEEGSELPKVLKEHVKESLSSYENQEIELELENRAFSFVLTPIKETGYVNIYGRDISERKKTEEQLKESEEKFRNIFDAIPDIYFLLSGDTTILDYRSSMKDLYIAPESFIGKKISDVMPKDIAEKSLHATKKVIETKNPQVFEYELIVNNEPHIFEARQMYLSDDRVSAFVRDITKRKKSEQQLKESEENYRIAYNRANFYKDLFAHDMNNVLNSILLSLELISEIPKKRERMDRIDELFSIVKESSNRGAQLISNVQKLSRLEESGVAIQEINVSTFLKDAISFIKNNFPDKDIKIEVEALSEDINVMGNELLLDVFENIMINSVKYNKNKQKEISIKISETEANDKTFFKFEFIDNGMGIEQYRKEKIFNVGNREYKGGRGMGLGLSLVKKIVESYGGTIMVEDKVPGDYSKGSNFIVLIPKRD